MTTTGKIRVLTTGLDAVSAEPYSHMDPAELDGILGESIDRMKADPHFDIEVAWLSLAMEQSKVAKQLEPYLDGQHWDAVLIGWGVRSNPEVSWLFEHCVNLVREKAPNARFIFSATPSDHLEAIYRTYPQKGPAPNTA